jgi:hypothetical protein
MYYGVIVKRSRCADVLSKKSQKTLKNYLTRKIANDGYHKVKLSKSNEQDL